MHPSAKWVNSSIATTVRGKTPIRERCYTKTVLEGVWLATRTRQFVISMTASAVLVTHTPVYLRRRNVHIAALKARDCSPLEQGFHASRASKVRNLCNWLRVGNITTLWGSILPGSIVALKLWQHHGSLLTALKTQGSHRIRGSETMLDDSVFRNIGQIQRVVLHCGTLQNGEKRVEMSLNRCFTVRRRGWQL